MIKMFKEFCSLSREMYDTDRKEFWDAILGIVVIVSFFLLLFYVINPIFTEGYSYLD